MLDVDVVKQLGEFTLRSAFAVPTPGVVALFGRSGCGKSTTLNILSGLLKSDLGRVVLDGKPLEDTAAGISVRAEHRRIGYVFQDPRLFPHLDVLGNLHYGLNRTPVADPTIAFDHVVELLGLARLLQRRPRDLSGGERQRVALGRALLSQPRLLLLDEPRASVGIARREDVW